MSFTPLPLHLRSESQKLAEEQMIADRTTLADWLHLIRAEYVEIPGLHLTKSQVQRLWGLEAVMCEALLAALIADRFLRQTQSGAYVRVDLGA